MKDLFARFALPVLALGMTVPVGAEADAKTKTPASSQTVAKKVVKKPAAKKPAAKPAATAAKKGKAEKPSSPAPKAKKAKAPAPKPAASKPAKARDKKPDVKKPEAKAPTGQCAAQKGSWKPVEVFTHVQSGEIIGDAADANKPSFFSSATKLMPMYITLKGMHNGTIKKDYPIKTKHWRYTSVYGSTNGSDEMPGNITAATPDVLLQYIAKRSSNDAPNTIAVHISGSREKFYDLENATAREIGMDMELNHFASATGYNEQGVVGKHKMTPLGMAQLMAKAYGEFPDEFKKLGSAQTTVYALDKKGRETEFKIKTKIETVKDSGYQFHIKELKFMKTGYTCTGGAAGVGIVNVEGIDFAFAYTGYPNYMARDAHINKTIAQIRDDIESGKIQKFGTPAIPEAETKEIIIPLDDINDEKASVKETQPASDMPAILGIGLAFGLAGMGAGTVLNRRKKNPQNKKRASAKSPFVLASSVSNYNSSAPTTLLSGGSMSFRAANPY